MDYSDNRGAVALARRFFIHLRAGGQIAPEDMGLIVEALERRDAALAPHHPSRRRARHGAAAAVERGGLSGNRE